MSFFKRLLGMEVESAVQDVVMPGEEPLDTGPTLEVGQATHIGKVRKQNQDAFFTLKATLSRDGETFPFGLFLVADGMGGQKGGGIASGLTARVAAEAVLREFYLPWLASDSDEGAAQRPISEVILEAANEANLAVHRLAPPEAGTTLTCALVQGTNAYIAHVGDSRAYLIRQGRLEQITQDHSLLARLIELGQISPEEAASHPQKNVLYKAIGQGSTLEVDFYLKSLPANSYLLLCSDGLWGYVSEERIAAIVREAPTPQAACQQLVQQANAAGGEDNITVILVQVKG
ncbi:MAG: PP2C family protein-serine/threonine phosphatase [Chloroflexota bacterium]